MDNSGSVVKEKRRDKNGWNLNEEKRVEKLKMKRAMQFDAQVEHEEELASGEVVSKRSKRKDKLKAGAEPEKTEEIVIDPLFGLPKGQKNRLKQQLEDSEDSI